MRARDVLGPAAIAALGASVMGALSLVVYHVGLAQWSILFGETYVLLYLLLVEAKSMEVKT